jgi:hypothetical protein
MSLKSRLALLVLGLFGSLSWGLLHVHATETAYVDLLKHQADERKSFYAEQATAKDTQKKDQAKEQQELLQRHRAAREQFTKDKHTADERRSFFKAERDEMGVLRTRQKTERQTLTAELKKNLDAFHSKQKRERDELKERLAHSGS